MTLRPEDVEFLLRVARGIVGRYGLDLSFAPVEGVERGRFLLWAGSAYGVHVECECTVVSASLALNPTNGAPMVPADVVQQLRRRLRQTYERSDVRVGQSVSRVRG